MQIIHAILTAFLLIVVWYGVREGAIKDFWLTVVLVVIALMLPSPAHFALKIKDWILVKRNSDQK